MGQVKGNILNVFKKHQKVIHKKKFRIVTFFFTLSLKLHKSNIKNYHTPDLLEFLPQI